MQSCLVTCLPDAAESFHLSFIFYSAFSNGQVERGREGVIVARATNNLIPLSVTCDL
jgi:hypothetical protein